MSLKHRFVWFFDQFSTPASLRTSGEPEYSSLCTGAFSLLLTLIFTYIFIMKCYEVFTFQSIDFKEMLDDKFWKEKEGSVMFAVRVREISSSLLSTPYFSFAASMQGWGTSSDFYEQFASVQLGLCNASYWEGIDEQLLSYYDLETEWLCPVSGPLKIQNTEKNEQQYRFIEITIDLCLSGVTCETLPNIEAYINSYTTSNGFMTAELLILDSSMHPKEVLASEPVLQEIMTTFTYKTGSIIQIQMAEYQIKTDFGVLPWKDEQTARGTVFYDSHAFGTVYDSIYNYLVIAKIEFAPKTLKIERSIGKIDSMLSYAGGLFAILIGFFSFFVQSYNEYKYELLVAGSTFTVANRRKQLDPESLSFWFYMKYSIYDWVRNLCCCELNWQDCKELDTAKEEATKQMDVIALFKKIQYLENMIDRNFPTSKRICVQLLRPNSLEEVSKKRRILHFYEKVITKHNVTTLQQAFEELSQAEVTKFPLESSVPMTERALKELSIEQIWLGVVKPYVSTHPELTQDIEIGTEDEDEIEDIWDALLGLAEHERTELQGEIPVVILYYVMKAMLEERKPSQPAKPRDSSETQLRRIFPQ